MSSSEPWTTKRLLEWTTSFLQENGSDSARLDAEVLLAEAKGCQRIQLYTCFDEVPPEEQLSTFRGWIKERAAGKPVAYLVGHREFYSLSFRVNEHVLIPRPETELLVTLAIDRINQKENGPSSVCDVGTGSGCIPISIAKNTKQSKFLAVDISADAIAVAIENAKQHEVMDRISFVQSDLFDKVDSGLSFDLIVSNPPYIGLKEKAELDSEVKDYEPEIALFGGEEGTEIIVRLLDQAASRLNSGGILMFETSPIVMDRCVELVDSHDGFCDTKVHQDLSKHPRVVEATLK